MVTFKFLFCPMCLHILFDHYKNLVRQTGQIYLYAFEVLTNRKRNGFYIFNWSTGVLANFLSYGNSLRNNQFLYGCIRLWLINFMSVYSFGQHEFINYCVTSIKLDSGIFNPYHNFQDQKISHSTDEHIEALRNFSKSTVTQQMFKSWVYSNIYIFILASIS